MAAGTHWTCGVRAQTRQLVCWGVTRDYPAEATEQYEEFGQVTGAAALVAAGACSWEAVAAGKHHACGVTAQSGAASDTSDVSDTSDTSDVTAPGMMRCWGSNLHGQSTPPGVEHGVTLPWRAWPSNAEAGGSTIAALRTQPLGQCEVTSAAAGRSYPSRARSSAVVAVVAVVFTWALVTYSGVPAFVAALLAAALLA